MASKRPETEKIDPPKNMNIVFLPLKEITPYYNNTKQHDKKQIEKVAQSIKEHGWTQPIVVDRNKIIIIGHCRRYAAMFLHLDYVPCLIRDDLTPAQVRMLRVADNKTNESEWDYEKLLEEIDAMKHDGVDIEQTGFSLGEIDDIAGSFNADDFDYMGDDDADETAERELYCSLTFTYAKDKKKVVERYLKVHGKESVMNEIIQKAESEA